MEKFTFEKIFGFFEKKVKFEKRAKCYGAVVELPSGKVTDTFNATDTSPVLTEDLKETLISLGNRKLGTNRDDLNWL